ncbi:MAG: hypothetical protein HC906_18505 [Bacteroidales bacterium]|nr:hypothetical protein [Bacteroidales bacterium]
MIALIINWGGNYSIVGLILLAIFVVIKTHNIHKKREEESKKREEELWDVNGTTVAEKCNMRVVSSLLAVTELYKKCYGFFYRRKKKETWENGK